MSGRWPAVWILGLLGLVGGACSGEEGAPKPDADADTDADTNTDTDTETDSETVVDTGEAGETGDTGWGPYAKAVRRYSITGEASVDVAAGTYDGVEVQSFENHVGKLCGVVYEASTLGNAPWTGPTSRADHGACAWLGTPCTFSFDLVMHDPAEDPALDDCAMFGIKPEQLPAYQVSYGFVEDVLLSGKTPGGTSGYSYTADLLLVWTEGVGWYPMYEGLFAPYFGLPTTTFDGETLVYTADFAEYY